MVDVILKGQQEGPLEVEMFSILAMVIDTLICYVTKLYETKNTCK